MRNGRILRVLGISLLAVGLAACGGSGEGEAPATGSEPSASQAASGDEAPAAEGSEAPSSSSGVEAGKKEAPPAVPITTTFNSWLSDAYEKGVGEPWETPGIPIGTSPDRSNVLLANYDYDGSTEFGTPVLHKVADGAVVKALEGLKCDVDGTKHALDGIVYCRTVQRFEDADFEIVAVDLSTGETESVLEGTGKMVSVLGLGVDGDTHFIDIRMKNSTAVVAVDTEASKILWTADGIHADPQRCFVFPEHLVCAVWGSEGDPGGPEQIVVLSKSDGTETARISAPVEMLGAMTDKGLVAADQLTGEAKLFRLDGTEEDIESPFSMFDSGVNFTALRSYYMHVGMAVPYDALMAKQLPGEIDRQGNAVVDSRELESLIASESGTVVLRQGGQDAKLVAKDSEEPMATFDPIEASVVDGIIVESKIAGEQRMIHPPAQ